MSSSGHCGGQSMTYSLGMLSLNWQRVCHQSHAGIRSHWQSVPFHIALQNLVLGDSIFCVDTVTITNTITEMTIGTNCCTCLLTFFILVRKIISFKVWSNFFTRLVATDFQASSCVIWHTSPFSPFLKNF